MNSVLQCILIVGAIIFLGFVVALVKRSKLQVKYALLWIILALSYFVLAIFPGIVDSLANLLHIEEKVNALFLITLFILLVLSFIYNLILSRQSSKIKFLIQELSIIKAEMKKTDKLANETNKED